MNITHNQHKKNKKVYTGILLVCLAVLSVLLACEEAATEEKNGVVSVSIVEGDSSLEAGTTLTLIAKVEVLGTTKDTVTWSSSDKNIATVVSGAEPGTGVVTAVKEGKATIIATSTEDTSKTATVKVTVTVPRVNSVTLALDDPKVTSIDKGSIAKMTATIDAVGTAVGTVVTFAETDENGNAVTPTGIVTLAPNQDGRTLELTGEKPGDTWIVATSFFDKTKKSAAIKITVSGVVSIAIEQLSFSFVVGTTQTLSTTEDAFGNALGKGVKWSSSNENLATVDTNGLVKAVAEGEATITATANADSDQTATIKVKVVEEILPLYYAEVFFGQDSSSLPVVDAGITIDTYINLGTTGTRGPAVVLPTIKPNTGEITVTTTTTAGTYIITATAGTKTFEALFYVIIIPKRQGSTLTEKAAINGAIKEGIDNFGVNADFNYIKVHEIRSFFGIFCKDYDINGTYKDNGRNYIRDFNGDISLWDVGNVTEMEQMFYNNIAFNRDISNWDVGKVTTMKFMFKDATAFKQNLENWGTKFDLNGVNTDLMFAGSGIELDKDLTTPTWYKP